MYSIWKRPYATSVSDFHAKVKESLLICDEPILNKIVTFFLFTYLIDPSHKGLYFNDIYYCYNYCINVTVVT